MDENEKKESYEEENIQQKEVATLENFGNKDFVYFVAFYHSRGFDNTEVTMTEEIMYHNQVVGLEEVIEEQLGFKDVKVTNFQALRLEDAEE